MPLSSLTFLPESLRAPKAAHSTQLRLVPRFLADRSKARAAPIRVAPSRLLALLVAEPLIQQSGLPSQVAARAWSEALLMLGAKTPWRKPLVPANTSWLTSRTLGESPPALATPTIRSLLPSQ